MRSLVNSHLRVTSEALVANWAGKEFLTSMYFKVGGEASLSGEALFADGASVRLFTPVVLLVDGKL